MNPAKTGSVTKNKILSLQAVRALAFLGIFTFHCKTTELGMWGVSVFLVLSGFLMAYAYYDKPLDSSVKGCVTFSIKKIKKLYPLHLLLMLIAAIAAAYGLLSNFSIKHAILYIGNLFLNVTLLQSWIPSSAVYFSLNGVAWYLSVCLFIYALFPIIIKYIKKLNYKKALLVAIGIYLLQIIIGVATQSVNIPYEHFDNFSKWLTYIAPIFRLGDFVIGCCLCNFYINKKMSISKLLASCFEILTVIATIIVVYIYAHKIGLLGSEWFRCTLLFTPTSACLVYLFAINKGILSKILTCKPLIYIGNVSAYTFLIHNVVLRCIYLVNHLMGITTNPYILVVVGLIVSIICAEVYKRIESKTKKVLCHS